MACFSNLLFLILFNTLTWANTEERVSLYIWQFTIKSGDITSEAELHFISPNYFKYSIKSGNYVRASHCDGATVYVYTVRNGKYVDIQTIDLSKLSKEGKGAAKQRAFLLATNGIIALADPDKATEDLKYFWEKEQQYRFLRIEEVDGIRSRTYGLDANTELSFDITDNMIVRQRSTSKLENVISTKKKETYQIPADEKVGLFSNLKDEPKTDITDTILKSLKKK
jgi:hypothetical protein